MTLMWLAHKILFSQEYSINNLWADRIHIKTRIMMPKPSIISPRYSRLKIMETTSVSENLWNYCFDRLKEELPAQQFNTWLRPLHGEFKEGTLFIYAPNKFVLDWVNQRFMGRISELVLEFDAKQSDIPIKLRIGSVSSKEQVTVTASKSQSTASYGHSANTRTESSAHQRMSDENSTKNTRKQDTVQPGSRSGDRRVDVEGAIAHQSFLNPNFTFDTFVEGKSNQLARAASVQVAENPGGAYNPLFLYGGVGLGKTHLMHSIGNEIVRKNPNAKVVYLHSERFVADMVKALQINAINDFKRHYRSVDALLIDDIQFFAKKERSQEEFFHTFNALLEGGQQMILTCDRYPKEIDDMEERLKSRFGWGLTVMVEPPELETRVAILMKKAEQNGVALSSEAAFFIAQKIRSNVRELEGALKLVAANAHFTGQEITPEFIRECLKDLLALHDKQISIDNIQRTVAEYYKIKVADLHSKRRTRSVTRPRQMAMALAKELTHHSLPEIGDSFGGRDHTTVLHACKKIIELRELDASIREDHNNFIKILTT